MKTPAKMRVFGLLCLAVGIGLGSAGNVAAQQGNAVPTVTAVNSESAVGKLLTVADIYSERGLSGHLDRGIAWTPDGKQVSFLEMRPSSADAPKSEIPPQYAPKTGPKKGPGSDLWIMDASSGERRVLVTAEKLEAMIPADTSAPTQATGLGRHAPAAYEWAPDGQAILFQGTNALVWFDLKSQTPRTLVSGKEALADIKISPDGKFVSFVREHNLWIAEIANGKERALTTGGREEVRKGELDWVYPEELDCRTAYWWAPDSSAVAFYEMDESKVSKYPLVDFGSFDGEAEMERYPRGWRRQSDCPRFRGAAKSWRATETDGHWRGDGHLFAAGELAAGFEASGDSAFESAADQDVIARCRYREREIARDVHGEGPVLDQRQR